MIGGTPSSGSTLLRVILGRHPSIAAGDETAALAKRRLFHVSAPVYRRSIERWIRTGFPTDFLERYCPVFASLEGHAWDRPALIEAARASRSHRELLVRFFNRDVATTAARRWLEKTPCNIYCFPVIRRLFPETKFIQLVRDARDAVVSHCGRGASEARAAGRWYHGTLTGRTFRYWSCYYELRYEDLVRDPASSVEGVCAFLGEDFDLTMIAPGESTGLRSSNPGWRSDPGLAISTASVGQYRTGLTETQRSSLRHLALSSPAREELSRRDPRTSAMSPVQLQGALGYGTDRLEDARRLPRRVVDAAESEFRAHRARMLRLHGVEVRRQVRLRR